MTQQDAKKKLKEHGRVEYRGVNFRETIKRENNWDRYTGKYVAIVEGEQITDTPVSLSVAFQLARPYFK